MGTVHFSLDRVKQLLDFATANKLKQFCFVHDQGVYLMPRTPEAPPKDQIVYASGCNPESDPDWWDFSRSKVGGDDFVEYFDVEKFMPFIAESVGFGHSTFSVVVNKSNLRFTTSKAKKW